MFDIIFEFEISFLYVHFFFIQEKNVNLVLNSVSVHVEKQVVYFFGKLVEQG